MIRREVALAVGGGGAVRGCWPGSGLTVWTGVVLAVAAAAALYTAGALGPRGPQRRGRPRRRPSSRRGAAVVDVPVPPSRLPAWFEPVRAVLGLAGVLAGAQLLVVNASSIAERLGVSQVVIGFTLVALGTSLPELVTTIAAQRRGETDLVVGNLFGSNLFNSLAGGAVVGFAAGRPARPGRRRRCWSRWSSPPSLAWALLRRGLRLTRAEGVVLLAIYALMMPLAFAGLGCRPWSGARRRVGRRVEARSAMPSSTVIRANPSSRPARADEAVMWRTSPARNSGTTTGPGRRALRPAPPPFGDPQNRCCTRSGLAAHRRGRCCVLRSGVALSPRPVFGQIARAISVNAAATCSLGPALTPSSVAESDEAAVQGRVLGAQCFTDRLPLPSGGVGDAVDDGVPRSVGAGVAYGQGA